MNQNFPRMKKTPILRVVLCFGFCVLGAISANAQTDYYWSPSNNVDTEPASGGTGAWNTGSTFWKTPNNTTSPNVAWSSVTPASANANFGGSSGTVTIADATTIQVNRINFLTANYNITRTGTGSLSLVGTTPTIQTLFGNSTITTPISGTNGLIATGSGETTRLTLSGNNSGLSGDFISRGADIGVQNANFAGTGTIILDSETAASITRMNVESNVSIANNIEMRAGSGSQVARIRSSNANTTLNGNLLFSSTGAEINFNLSGNPITINGNITRNPLKNPATVRVFAAGPLLTINGGLDLPSTTWISGNTRITTSGNSLSSVNTETTGRMALGASNALNSTVTVTGTGFFDLESDVTQTVASITSRIRGNTGSVLTINNAALVTNNQQIGGTGDSQTGVGIRKTDAGELVLGGSTSNFTGGTTVDAGTLTITNAASLGASTGSLTVNAGTLNLNSAASSVVNVGRLSGLGGTIRTTTSGLKTLNTSFDTVSSTYAGSLANSTGTLALSKGGSGSLALTGASTFSGGTTVNAGTLLVNNVTGSGLGSGDVAVEGGTLGGTGSFTGSATINSGGTLSPGASIETLASGALTFANDSTFHYEIDSSVPSSSGADLMIVAGNLSFSGTVTLSLDNLALSPSAVPVGTTFSLINYSGTWNDGLFTHNAVSLANNAAFTFNSQVWQITYDAPTGGENFTSQFITGSFVNITAIPEPSAAVLFLGSMGVVLWMRRRIRNN